MVMLKPDYASIVEANYRVSKYKHEIEHQRLVRETRKPQTSRSLIFGYRLIVYDDIEAEIASQQSGSPIRI